MKLSSPRFVLAVCLAVPAGAWAQPAASIITISSGAASASGTTINFGQPMIGLQSVQPSGSPSANLGFIPAAGGTCAADFDGNGTIAVQDIFAFLSAWFAGNPIADIDGIPGIGVQDMFAFLSAWFAGCP